MTQKRGWPLTFGFLRSPPERFSATIVVVALIMFIALLVIATLALGWVLADLISGDQHRAAEASKTALPIVAAAIGLPLLIWRLIILDRQTRISEQKTQIDRETHYTSIFSRSIDQLGQTRELKLSEKTGETVETITRTVPNIEVRLGGIHSLARLAEESTRDRSKIESTLRSYVRENSWFNNDGLKKEALQRIGVTTEKWSRNYRSGKIADEAKSAYKLWLQIIDQSKEASDSWLLGIKETRVDVSEAIDAARAIEVADKDSLPRPFFECLFVGRHFYFNSITSHKFERCVFVRCTITTKDIKLLKLDNCHIIDSNLFIFDSKIDISNTEIQRGFLSLDDSHMYYERCNSIDSSVDMTGNSTIEFSTGFAHNLWFFGTQASGARLIARGFTFSDCNFSGMKFSDGSELSRCAFAECSFEDADLTQAKISSQAALETVMANEATQLPEGMERPQSWASHIEYDHS